MKGPIENSLTDDDLDHIKEVADEIITNKYAGKEHSDEAQEAMLSLRRAYVEYRLGFGSRDRQNVANHANTLKRELGEHAGSEAARDVYKAVDTAIDNAVGVARQA